MTIENGVVAALRCVAWSLYMIACCMLTYGFLEYMPGV